MSKSVTINDENPNAIKLTINGNYLGEFEDMNTINQKIKTFKTENHERN